MNAVDNYNSVMLEKAKLDRWFSKFLDEHGKSLDQDESYSNESWKEYKKMLKIYDEVDRRARVAYYNVTK